MLKGIMRLPKLTTRHVWIGGYGGHYDALVIFHTKPVPSTKDSNYSKGIWYDCLDNEKNIAGCIEPDTFKELFGIDVSHVIEAIEVTKLIEVRLTAVWDENRLVSFDFNLDGW